MIRKLGSVIIALAVMLLSGCSDDSSDNQTPQTIQGVVIGSHYEGAWVCVDLDSNGVCDGETITFTDANGTWTLDDPKDTELNIVAEIYVDNIKHSVHPAPPSSTLVENPMIFVAPLKGEEDSQLIVSPISTMVHKSMQEFDLPFEAAKESVAKEVGVSSNILLTNYNVENPSPDQLILLERSAVEIEKLELKMSYHHNKIQFSSNSRIDSGKYVVTDFYIHSSQDPNRHIQIGTDVKMSINDDLGWVGTLDFVLGRSGAYDVATWWRKRVSSDENNYNKEPDKLNFAMKGDFTMVIEGKTYILKGFFIAQGHNWAGNNWWIGSQECSYDHYYDFITCDCEDGSGNAKKITFNSTDNNSNNFLVVPK